LKEEIETVLTNLTDAKEEIIVKDEIVAIEMTGDEMIVHFQHDTPFQHEHEHLMFHMVQELHVLEKYVKL